MITKAWHLLKRSANLAHGLAATAACTLHVVYVPYLGTSHEFKSKPAQNALNELRGFGIVPDVVGVRTDSLHPAPHSIADKISTFGGVPRDGVLMMPNCHTVYEVPLTVARGLDAKN